MADVEASGAPDLEPGDKVEVRDAFEGQWHRGFVVDAVVDGGYRVRRTSDDTLLPRVLGADVVRSERRRSMWWI